MTESAFRCARETGIDVATVFVESDVPGVAMTREIPLNTGFAKDFAVVNSHDGLAQGVIEAMRPSS
ncbi:hypothetical protein G3N95_09800 [Paraburkholderia sp. Tr-20389]|uniref:hypothetical protein n=1 Tax=Paraburkholderia sp. Tr-20389 TaxID=2703903 RepID=UPI00197F7212|nr:hypothetical protein [Paraburkholderia sp. Tr-20389]MBN3753238.1 hypothetical protein [Paraburkholderia sp. Tr-20389]